MLTAAWGLNEKERYQISLPWKTRSNKIETIDDSEKFDCITPKMLSELSRIHDDVKEELRSLTAPFVTEESIGNRLMFLFQVYTCMQLFLFLFLFLFHVNQITVCFALLSSLINRWNYYRNLLMVC